MKKSTKHSAHSGPVNRTHPSFPPQGMPMSAFAGQGSGQGVPPNVAPNEAMSNTPSAYSGAGNAPAAAGINQ